MKNAILIAVVLISLQSVCAQNSEINLIDSDKVIEDIKLCGINSNFYTNLDYQALLYLYPQEFDLLNKLKPKTLHLTKNVNFPGAIRELPFESNEIKDLIGKEEILRQIIKMVSVETIYKIGDIYIKSPDKAFVNISGDTWSSSYGFQLEEEKLKLKYEIKNIE